MGDCGAAVAEVEEPAVKLKKIVGDVEPRAFRQALDSKLLEIRKLREKNSGVVDKPRGSSSGSVTDKILEIKEITAVLGERSDRSSTCRPELQARAVWRVINSADGQPLEERVSGCAIATSADNFKEWFADAAQRQAEVTAGLESLGRQVVLDLLSTTSSFCGYGMDPTAPELVDDQRATPYRKN
jgi:hypothetical protein